METRSNCVNIASLLQTDSRSSGEPDCIGPGLTDCVMELQEELVADYKSGSGPVTDPVFLEGEVRELTNAELNDYWPQLPYAVRKAINKQKKGTLQPVTKEELEEIHHNFLNNKK